MADYSVDVNILSNLPGFGGGGGSIPGGVPVGGGVTPQQQQQVAQHSIAGWQMMRKVFLPFIAGAGLAGMMMQLVNSSKVLGIFSKTGAEILDALLTVVFIPLIPVFMGMNKMLLSLLPVLNQLSQFLLGPLGIVLTFALDNLNALLRNFFSAFEKPKTEITPPGEVFKKLSSETRFQMLRESFPGYGVPESNPLFPGAKTRYKTGFSEFLPGESLASKFLTEGALKAPTVFGATSFSADKLLDKMTMNTGASLVDDMLNSNKTMVDAMVKGLENKIISPTTRVSALPTFSRTYQILNNININTGNTDPSALANELRDKLQEEMNFEIRGR